MEIEEDNSRKSNGNRLSITERWKIIGYFECCQSQSKTTDHFNVNQSKVSRILSKVKVQKDVKDYQKFGRFEILKAEDESVIEEMIEKNKMVTLQQIADILDVNRCTALKKMHEIGLNFSLPNKVPQLNSLHIQKRLNHCTSLKDKNTDNIIFTDETYLKLYRNTLGNWHFLDDNFVSIPQTRVCLMAYGCICESGKSKIFIYEKGFQTNSEAYCSVLEKILIPCAEKEFTKKTRKSKSVSKWYLLQDNAPCHNQREEKHKLKAKMETTVNTFQTKFEAISFLENLSKDLYIKTIAITVNPSIEQESQSNINSEQIDTCSMLNSKIKATIFDNKTKKQLIIYLENLLKQYQEYHFNKQQMLEDEELFQKSDDWLSSAIKKQQQKKTKNSTILLENEINIYLGSPIIQKNVDVLSYWMSKQQEFPQLSCLAKDLLAISSTSVPCEQVNLLIVQPLLTFFIKLFSKTGQILTDRRKKMKPETLRILTCLDSWINILQ